MKLRNKISIIILFIWMVMVATLYLSSQFIIKKSYLRLEEESAHSNLQRLNETIDQMASSVSNALGSWAIWDDTYIFMKNKNEDYIQSNLQVSSFTSSDIDMVLYFTPDGKPFFTIAADPTRTQEAPLPIGLEDYLSPSGKIVYQPNVDSSAQGLISIPSGMLIVAAHSIVNSKNTGPVHGTLMMGRYFTDASLQKLEQITKVDADIHLLSQIKNNPKLLGVYEKLKTNPFSLVRINDEMLIGYSLLKDINDKPIALLQANLPRNIYQAGIKTIYYYNFLAIISSVMLILVLWVSLHSIIVRRIEKLISNIINMEHQNDAASTFPSGIQDEVSFVSMLYQHATHDPLTGLGNRHLIYQGFDHRVASVSYGNNIALLFIDIDHFKYVNDTLGHEVGDALLIHFAKKLKSNLRAGDLAVRLGGDEFVVMLVDVNKQTMENIINTLFASLKGQVVIHGHELYVTCSMGISLFPDNGDDIPTLLKDADIALYHAKESGRNQYQYYSNDLQKAIQEANKKELELQHAIDNKELCLYYQPIYDIKTKEITNIEALIRWRHPKRGLLLAAEIIPLAEKSGLIIPIGKWVLETACAQAKAWQKQGLPCIPIAVNVSLLQIKNFSVNKLVTEALNDTGLDPHCLELELTETSYIEITANILAELEILKARGIKLAVDDFGVGYSGLGYLKSLPITKLKIDQSFIRDIHHDADDRAIVLAIIAIAHQMKLQVVAEGVETNAQYKFLKSHGVNAVQGNYFSPPLGAESCQKLIESTYSVTE